MDSGRTLVERLKASLEAASAHNPNDAEKPVAVLWTDRDAQWRPILQRLRALMPQLLVLGQYEPENRTGPSIWLRCVVDRVLELPGFAGDTTPVIYLPDVGRQALGSAEACPSDLKPLVELQYRGTCWTQKNGRDWTVEAFMVSSDGGLGLDVARDAATRQSMLSALPELATTSIRLLEGRRLEANDFDALFSDDPVRDLLLWLSDPESALAGWELGRRSAFVSRCKSDFQFDPDTDGALVAAERLGRREESWESVWSRFAESPALYPGLPELLRKAIPRDLFVEQPSSWPQSNEKGEADLRRALVALEGRTPSAAREAVVELEESHGPRRGWVWAKLDLTPLANALMHLAEVAAGTSRELGGVTPAEMAAQYAGMGLENRCCRAIQLRRSELVRGYELGEPCIERHLPAVAGRGSASPSGIGGPETAPTPQRAGCGRRARRFRRGHFLRGRPPPGCIPALGGAPGVEGAGSGNVDTVGRTPHGDRHRKARRISGVRALWGRVARCRFPDRHRGDRASIVDGPVPQASRRFRVPVPERG